MKKKTNDLPVVLLDLQNVILMPLVEINSCLLYTSRCV